MFSRSKSPKNIGPEMQNEKDEPPPYAQAVSPHAQAVPHVQSGPKTSTNPFRTGTQQVSTAQPLVPTTDYSPLAKYDTAILIDDSGSMAGSNWAQTAQALADLVPILTKHDSNGIDVYFLNNTRIEQGVRSASDVFNLFTETRPRGCTPTGKRLGAILRAYLERYKRDRHIKPLNIIVITDGSPTDPACLESELIRAARELDRLRAPQRQVGVQFFQVGNDEGAAESLEELDNALAEENEIRDMVDTVNYKAVGGGSGQLSADGMLKVVLGAVDGNLDRKRFRLRKH